LSALLRLAARRLGRAALNFHRDNCLDLSATVAFYSLLSLGPLLYLASIVLQLVHGGPGELRLALERLSVFVPQEAARAFDRVARSLRGGQGLVLLAVPALLWVATTAFSALEGAVNVAFGSRDRGGLWLARLKAMGILAVGWLLLAAMLLLNAVVALLDRQPASPSVRESLSGLTEAMSYAGLLGVSFLIFALFFKFLPRTRVSWRAAGWGALLALALWEGARRLFGWVLLHSPALGLLTGALAGTVTFLLWVYTAVAVVLLGAELAALVNGSRDDAPRPPRRAPSKPA